MRRHGREGYVLITAGVCLLAVLGALGLAMDLGRLYIIKNELQAYADSAALAAALELDGTTAGISRAMNVVAGNPNRWNMASMTVSGALAEFSTAAAGPWEGSPNPAAGYRFIRVQVQATVPLYTIAAVGAGASTTARATAVAGQVEKTTFREALFPFSPIAHDTTPPHFGFTPGQLYTLRWAANPNLNANVCAGDNEQVWIDLAQAGSASERGYIEETSSDLIRSAIEQDALTRTISIGDTLSMTGGNKQTQRNSLINRINQDTDPVSATYAEYVAAGTGNGRRLVGVIANSGYPEFRALGMGLFFLLPASEYDPGGSKPFCAEYVGSYVQGSRHKGAAAGGAYVVRLVG